MADIIIITNNKVIVNQLAMGKKDLVVDNGEEKKRKGRVSGIAAMNRKDAMVTMDSTGCIADEDAHHNNNRLRRGKYYVRTAEGIVRRARLGSFLPFRPTRLLPHPPVFSIGSPHIFYRVDEALGC